MTGADKSRGLGRRSGQADVLAVEGDEVLTVKDQFDVDIEDHDLLGEIELLTGLIITLRDFDRHLSEIEIDIALGLTSGIGGGVDPTAVAVDPSEGEPERP